ncbi:retinal guanylyl cyclase 2 isoform X1 [Danio rerio]|uniref:Retinal guanylyl cyclase 2 isoform X1 n=3 Tax=Danio rerio TaxID=7955 RepID=A0AC58FXA4_DANRE|nr:retinal guanylyl cyclase 2 isoform X1 [Danio rerio]|eukprot:XP_021333059.1 retinal guanylyl cyclase 2 isoform X1 [Danio rerio]
MPHPSNAFHSFLPARGTSGLRSPSQMPHFSSDPKHIYLCLLWSTIILCLLPATNAATIKVGVVGPWSCDPIFTKAQPGVAARLAVAHINKDPYLSQGITFDYIILDEDCETSKSFARFLGYYTRASGFIGPVNPGYCEAASLLGKSWNKAVFSWSCIEHELDDVRSHPTFARTMPVPSLVLLSFMRHFRWAHVGIISSSEDVWVEAAIKLANALRSHGLPVGIVTSARNDHTSVRQTLAKVRKVADLRLVILVMHSVLIGGRTQKLLLETAHDMRMTDGSLVFMSYDTLFYSLPYHHVTQPALRYNSKLLRAYDAVLTITIESPKEQSFYQAFEKAQEDGELPKHLKPQQVSPLFGTIYSSIVFMAHAVQSVRAAGQWMSGGNIAQNARNLLFKGGSSLQANSSDFGMLDYVILDTDGFSWELQPTYRIEMQTDMVRFLGRHIHFPYAGPPRTDSSCWFTHGIICRGGVNLFHMISMFLLGFLFIFLSIGCSYCIRRKINKIRLVRGPNKILLTLNDVTFINPSLSNKKLSVDDSKASDTRMSISERSLVSPMSSQSPATYENSNVAIYEGDWAWMKRLPYGTFRSITPNTSDVFELMKDLRHENINPFLGFFHDCGVFAIVTEFCSRGSLEDLLVNDDVKLDWMFKSSLILDLIKGMKYLHHRNVCHGRLKSRNCVVDGRFVLKITDYGYNEVLESQRFPYIEPPAEDLLWTAPEILRGSYPGLHGTHSGDVYSFSIIMQEVVMRGPPFCMLENTFDEIVQKVRKPPPMCRPIVSPDHAPMECIQLMKQCWNEQPEKRPTFDEIFDQFKNVNKGKKTNIIDSMLRMLEQYSSNLEELIRERTEELEIEKQKTEKLLTQMLPPSVAEALKLGTTVEPEHFESVSLYFSDIVGFTTISANSEPIEVVDLLNDLYTTFDAVIGNHDVYKVETIGDAYMVASGVPVPNGNRHAAEIANMALDILSAVGTFRMRHMPDVPVRIRIGLHTGPCVAGVVGLTMPRYCLFGDTVTTASRMESTGLPYRIHVHSSTVKILMELKLGYRVELRARTELKGKRIEETYWLTGRDGFTKPLPVPPVLKSGLESKDFKVMLKKAVRKISTVRQVAQLTLSDEGNVMIHHHDL